MSVSEQTAAHHEALRAWARGSYPLEAATELLIRAQRGRWARTDQMWVRVEPTGQVWIDFAELVDQLAAGGPWSGGERRILALAAALGADDGLLNDTVPGLDRDNVALVLAAVSHAAGSHDHVRSPSSGSRTTRASRGRSATPTGPSLDCCTRGRLTRRRRDWSRWPCINARRRGIPHFTAGRPRRPMAVEAAGRPSGSIEGRGRRSFQHIRVIDHRWLRNAH